MTKVNCLVCDKELEITEEFEAMPSGYYIPCLNDGIVCESHGNYGSSLFDPMYENEILQFYVCDQCLKHKSDKVKWFHLSYVQETKVLETKSFADLFLEYDKHRSIFLDLKNKHLETKTHLWHPVPAPGKFRCLICDKYISETIHSNRKNFFAIWGSVCPGKVIKEELKSDSAKEPELPS